MLPLFTFFERLRLNDFSLGIREYKEFLGALETIHGLTPHSYHLLMTTLGNYTDDVADVYPKDSMFRLAKALWLKPCNATRIFEDLFEETWQLEKSFYTTSPLPKPSPAPAPSDDTLQTPGTHAGDNDTTPLPPITDDKREETFAVPEDRPRAGHIRIAIGAGQGDGFHVRGDNIRPERTKFLFTKEYYPLDRRKIAQNLKGLAVFREVSNSMEPDLPATIRATVDRGYFSKIVFKKDKRNATHILLLIDHQGTMLFFQQLIDIIHTQVGKVLHGEKIAASNFHVRYFYNVPENFLHKENTLTSPEPLDNLLITFKKIQTGIIILSDAGAGRATVHASRVEKTKVFIDKLQKVSSKIVWLNPYPRERWKNTTAQHIAELIPMFEANETGVLHAVARIKGSSNAKLNRK